MATEDFKEKVKILSLFDKNTKQEFEKFGFPAYVVSNLVIVFGTVS
jgi:hypothetical protein